jgi:hypothetical protein
VWDIPDGSKPDNSEPDGQWRADERAERRRDREEVRRASLTDEEREAEDANKEPEQDYDPDRINRDFGLVDTD